MLPSGRLAIVEVVEFHVAKLLAGSREPAVIVEGGITKLDTATEFGQVPRWEMEAASRM